MLFFSLRHVLIGSGTLLASVVTGASWTAAHHSATEATETDAPPSKEDGGHKAPGQEVMIT